MGCFREPVIVQEGSPFWGEDLYFRRHFLLQFLVILILYVVERKWCMCGRGSEDSPVIRRGARDDGKEGEWWFGEAELRKKQRPRAKSPR